MHFTLFDGLATWAGKIVNGTEEGVQPGKGQKAFIVLAATAGAGLILCAVCLAGGGPKDEGTTFTYVVQQGDTMKEIAGRFGTSLAEIRTDNPGHATLAVRRCTERLGQATMLRLQLPRESCNPQAKTPSGEETIGYTVWAGDKIVLRCNHGKARNQPACREKQEVAGLDDE